MNILKQRNQVRFLIFTIDTAIVTNQEKNHLFDNSAWKSGSGNRVCFDTFNFNATVILISVVFRCFENPTVGLVLVSVDEGKSVECVATQLLFRHSRV